MFSEYRAQINGWIRGVTNCAPDDRNTVAITSKVMDRHFKEVYQSVELCRQLVEISIHVIVRRFLKQYSTEPGLNPEDHDALFNHYGIRIEDERILLKKIAVQAVWVPSRDKFCNVYDCSDCSPEELDEAADYLNKLASEIDERARYIRMLAQYRRQNGY